MNTFRNYERTGMEYAVNTILREVAWEGKSEGWHGDTILLRMMQEKLSKFNVTYADQGVWILQEQKTA